MARHAAHKEGTGNAYRSFYVQSCKQDDIFKMELSKTCFILLYVEVDIQKPLPAAAGVIFLKNT
jgi:hypothetical protein